MPLCGTIETAAIQWLRKNITVMLLKLFNESRNEEKRLHIVNKSVSMKTDVRQTKQSGCADFLSKGAVAVAL